jgi:hypothetical protein
MKPSIQSNFKTDKDGNPAGGATLGTGLTITWQNGTLGRGTERRKKNGALVEDVINAAIDRLEFFQTESGGKFSCYHNACAIQFLRQALSCLRQRTEEREARGVEGTHAA